MRHTLESTSKYLPRPPQIPAILESVLLLIKVLCAIILLICWWIISYWLLAAKVQIICCKWVAKITVIPIDNSPKACASLSLRRIISAIFRHFWPVSSVYIGIRHVSESIKNKKIHLFVFSSKRIYCRKIQIKMHSKFHLHSPNIFNPLPKSVKQNWESWSGKGTNNLIDFSQSTFSQKQLGKTILKNRVRSMLFQPRWKSLWCLDPCRSSDFQGSHADDNVVGKRMKNSFSGLWLLWAYFLAFLMKKLFSQ